ncbi:ligand-dependent corepressor [Crotalus adamanteus]|uniref:Ligand-dependent corepressor n=1 Tax=Crotalus adamanteus TaxID=8729 RepID=A0AAW1BG17_CROAD
MPPGCPAALRSRPPSAPCEILPRLNSPTVLPPRHLSSSWRRPEPPWGQQEQGRENRCRCPRCPPRCPASPSTYPIEPRWGLIWNLFKDFEPEGVSDWSFDENCLFCCLRREKVKEHFVSLDDPALEVGQHALLKQEQTKITWFERQAEEFLHEVFYRKDSPRVSDPNISLVAREIMQRMIRQFAAEYTSKTSSTQDSSSPNSTKNQSLLKASPVASSTAGARAQNPVLSKLLMADQDSPLDLTVRKSQLDSSEQDGVLDLSTKKSPCAGNASLSHSPGCSATPGNGTFQL